MSSPALKKNLGWGYDREIYKIHIKVNAILKQINTGRGAYLFISLFALLFIVDISHAASKRPVRILLAGSVPTAEITARSKLTASEASTGKRLKIDAISKARITNASQGLKVNGKLYPVEAIKFSAGGEPISFKGKVYRGAFVIGKGTVRELDVVNHVDIEEYLKGVLPLEMPPKWPLEALIAQSIAARTYTIYKMEETVGKGWDVVATTGDQVYGGKAKEVESTSKAVKISRGVTLSFEGKPARTYYHSTSGIRTESSKIVFDETPLPYLMGVTCIYGNDSPHRFWKEEIPYSEIETILRKNGVATGKIIKLTPKSFTTSGRILEINLHTISEKTTIKATLFRKFIGSTRIKSTWFRMRNTIDKVALSGRGFGHGVGLCQWGAKGMAERGMNYKQILLHYYPGTTLSPSEISPGYRRG